MSFAFDSQADLVIVRAALFGPVAFVDLLLAVDTGSTQTVVARRKLRVADYDLENPITSLRVATGSQVEILPLLRVDSLGCLSQLRDGFEVLAHDLPASPQIDGVLGLDFLRGHRLTLDFRAGEIELA